MSIKYLKTYMFCTVKIFLITKHNTLGKYDNAECFLAIVLIEWHFSGTS